jgi:hypothetical protein
MRSRTPVESDWPAIRALANQALPNAPDGNNAWMAARKAFASGSKRGVHRLFEDDKGSPLAFGAIEETGHGRARLFLVTHPDRLEIVGDEVLRVLIADANDKGATAVWMREHIEDPLVPFALKRGFTELQRYSLGAEHGAYAGIDVLEIQRRL